ncbi:sulfatase-like hydrolase/transferase [Variovorax sp. J22R115]|nr:sulfatase-like hydrolase/transferase [Variovorax sp. J22R115]
MIRSTPAPRSAQGPWRLAWVLLIPLGLWLGLAKTALVMNALFAAPEDAFRWVALLQWLWWFTSLHFLLAMLAGLAIQRLVLPRRRWTFVPISVAVLILLALMFPMTGDDHTVARTLQVWTITAAGQVSGLVACLWRDIVSIAVVVFALGLVLKFTPARARAGMVLLLQMVVIALCALVGIDLAYQLATGQPTSSRVLLFAALNVKEVAPLIAPEATSFRALAIGGGIFVAAGWAWHHRRLAALPMLAGRQGWGEGVLALALALGILLPAPAHGFLPLLRHTEGTLITLAKTAAPTLAHDIQLSVAAEFVRTGRPRWHSAQMLARQTEATDRKNVVIVMLESMRAVSTTMYTPTLQTTPFMASLASDSLVVEDMTAVIPRTAAAWVAILGGQYPLANEGTQNWARENRKKPRIRSLPSVLRQAGYATSFFTPTDLHFQNDLDVVDIFNFEFIQTEKELARPGAERVTYFGIADEWMVQPILDWTAIQVRAKRPFFTAVMTNVGHHNFETPSTWRKLVFEGVSNPKLDAYYNCLRYIDGVLSTLMEGYRRLGVLKDTIFVFVGDHGQMFDEHGAKQIHNAIYQEGLHVPTLIYAPGMALAPGRVRGPRQQIDVFPTIAELLGLQIEGAELPGQSLLHAVDPERELFYTSSIDWSFLSARHGHRKYVYSFDREPMEVFDLDKDPKELASLRDVDVEELARMKQRMLEWRINAEASMFAYPTDGLDPSAAWLPR